MRRLLIGSSVFTADVSGLDWQSCSQVYGTFPPRPGPLMELIAAQDERAAKEKCFAVTWTWIAVQHPCSNLVINDQAGAFKMLFLD